PLRVSGVRHRPAHGGHALYGEHQPGRAPCRRPDDAGPVAEIVRDVSYATSNLRRSPIGRLVPSFLAHQAGGGLGLPARRFERPAFPAERRGRARRTLGKYQSAVEVLRRADVDGIGVLARWLFT